MTRPVENLSSHVDARWGDVVGMLRTTVGGGHSLCHLGHYTNGVADLSVDVVDDVGNHHIDCTRDDYSRIARQLNLSVSDLEAELAAAGTGSLLRVVLNGRDAAVHCAAVVPNQHVIGFAEAARGGRAGPGAEALVSELVLRLRDRLAGRPSGAWPSGSALTPRPLPTGERRVARATGREDTDPAAACRRAVGFEALHYAAWCTPDGVVSVDCLDDDRLDPATRRARTAFGELGARFPRLVGQFSRVGLNALGGRLEHVGVHLERGAIHCRRVRPGHSVVGLTLHPGAVDRAEDLVADLAGSLARTG
ncbi:hypothetical protein [Saccharothrix xinjiangensis]|uniref:Uncharacterized protein n=1 Tax=Saccharothrix xinjiangensis TaxID=204798 RepID=A0ABV9YA38_9PSEU